MYAQYRLNTAGRDFVVGDIHGCFSLLSSALRQHRFDPHVDHVFSVGDLVDRGPESERAIEWLAQPWFHAVRGNHEQMAIDYVSGELDLLDYRRDGGGWFIDLPVEQQVGIARAFSALPIAIDIETPDGTVGIVHADCPFDSWDELIAELRGEDKESAAHLCMWSRERIADRNRSGVANIKDVFVGHTVVARERTLGNVHYIDTGAVFSHTLTVIPLYQR